MKTINLSTGQLVSMYSALTTEKMKTRNSLRRLNLRDYPEEKKNRLQGIYIKELTRLRHLIRMADFNI